ncbi:MAG TPA: hypothetical protein VM261_18140 [Kofleriaceae bacterium]|nr:hypothetical protein [Kofleriaceae bacterium]
MSAALAITLCLQAQDVSASACIYDKDCPGGYVCDVGTGACKEAGYQSPPTSSSPSTGGPSSGALIVGVSLAVVLIVVGLVMLNQQSQDTPMFLESEHDMAASQPARGFVISF